MNQTVPYEVAYQARDDLQQYGKNARLLFALQLRFRIEDIHSIAAECLTDGPDDKGCDLIYVDRDSGYAVIAQGYEAERPGKRSAPSNKVNGLFRATSWVLDPSVSGLPDRLKPAAQELRSAIESKSIRSIYFWYVHNLIESENVEQELLRLEGIAKDILRGNYKDYDVEEIEVKATEVGQQTLEEWYQASLTPILVTETFRIKVSGGYEIRSEDWCAFATAVPAHWLYEAYKAHGAKLFSANIRDYLGSRRSDRNINNGIKETAKYDPGHFWVFNNGLTGLVNDFHIEEGYPKTLVIKGLSIVNGAQTTGAIGSLSNPPNNEAMVPARFVKCNNQETIQSIIQYNNSQNRVEAADFRSNDAVQKRLREEFQKIPNATYLGGRRGGVQDTISRQPNLIPSNTAAQALAAFHQDPVTAYNEKSNIWSSDKLYSTYFNEGTHAEHIVFAYSLLRCIENKKSDLKAAERSGQPMTDEQKKQLSFLRHRGATLLFVSAVAKCLETFCGKKVPNPFRLSFGRVSPREAAERWVPIVEATIPFCGCLTPAVENGLKSKEKVAEVTDLFKAFVEQSKVVMQPVYSEFAGYVILGQ
ncbi:AIPR family protein [Moorella sp. ACPs]|uniref:AIPR family protein n=1 Tax=Neomoorella carbonis TaxID=3062783 RepID=UPI003243C9EF